MTLEIPLLRESAALSHRLIAAAGRLGESRYRFQRRVNWSWRHSAAFYEREAELFCANPDDYVSGRIEEDAALDDIFVKRLSLRNIAAALAKVASHTIFAAIGGIWPGPPRPAGWIYRKCYVDDIELVFDSAQSGVVRAVFPFPISIGRQWRYLRYLRKRRAPFVLDGNRYAFRDVVRLLLRRDLESLARMEARAEIRRAARLAKDRPALAQLSDEFNIGSLDFSRYLARAKVPTINVAHGVGKYFPVHAYQHFDFLTDRQREFYLATVPCTHGRHTLNAEFGVQSDRTAAGSDGGVVILGQDFGDPDSLIAKAEKRVAAAVREASKAVPGARLYYKPHPNNRAPEAPEGFQILDSIDAVTALRDPILLSLFSTTHLDPRFRGRKFLVRSGLIRPEIAFDDDGRIVDVERIEAIFERDC